MSLIIFCLLDLTNSRPIQNLLTVFQRGKMLFFTEIIFLKTNSRSSRSTQASYCRGITNNDLMKYNSNVFGQMYLVLCMEVKN